MSTQHSFQINCDPVNDSVSFQNAKGGGLWLNFFSDKGKYCLQPLHQINERTLIIYNKQFVSNNTKCEIRLRIN